MAIRLLIATLALSGCGWIEHTKHELFIDEIKTVDARTLCAGADACITKKPHEGLTLCTLISLPDVGMSELGRLARGCLPSK